MKIKKLLSVLLMLAMLMTCMSTVVFGAETAVAKIGSTEYATLEEAFAAATDGETITLLNNATPALTSQRAITKAATIDLNGKNLKLTEDDLYFGTTTFKNGNIVIDPSVKPSTAVFWMFANQTLTFDKVKLTASGVTGTYLIGLDGNNADLNILNGSEIIVENSTALDLDIICVNSSTGNDIVIDNSRVSVTNLDGRVFFRGNYTVSGNTDIDLKGITRAGFRIEAGQTLTIKDSATVDIEGEPRDGGIHLNAVSAIYNKEDSAIVNATFKRPAVAKIGDTEYADFNSAIAAAKNMTGDVTVEIYDKVTLNQNLSGSYSAIKFVGKDTDAEIYLDVQGYIEASGKTVSFEDLILSKSAGDYIYNAGFMNVAFGVYQAESVNYTDCTFANGAYASKGTNTFTDCTFKRSYDKYSLWAYGDVEVVVDNCKFDDYRGIKMYAEGAAKTVALTVKNTDFSAVTDKPAIVLTYGESVVLEGNTYSSTGVFELDLDGDPNGTPVTGTDVKNATCVNDKGVCGVLVDGKIYTTVAQAAEVAAEGSTVILIHDSAETVEFEEGVILDKNGFTAENVTVTNYSLPTATVTELDTIKLGLTSPLTFALNFLADEVTDAQLEYYGNWYADYVLTVNKTATFNADGSADGYLAGQYDEWSENWVYVPFENVKIEENKPFKVMEYAAKLINQPGLKLTYNDVYYGVKDFDCGIYFDDEFLAANPDLEVTLELRMYNPENEEESYAIGRTYEFKAADLKPEILKNSLYVTYTETGKWDFGAGETDSIKLSLFGGIDSLNYSEVGFDVTIGDKTERFPVKVVYGAVKTKLNGEVVTIPASEFGRGVNYIYGYTINFPATDEFENTEVEWSLYAKKGSKEIPGGKFTLDDFFPGTLSE